MARRSFATASSGPSLWLWLGLAAVVIVLDQFTKTLILGDFSYGESRPVTSFFNVVRVHNTGAAFSFLAGASGWQRWFFVGLGAAAAVFIVWLLRSHGGQRLFATALALILGGALGNVVDRLMHGAVVDFLYFHAGRHGWPAFNLADAAITLGVGMMLWAQFRGNGEARAEPTTENMR